MPTAKKEQLVQELEEKFKSAQSVVLTEYRGLKANDMVELRKELREQGLEYKVVKNRLALLAAENAGVTIDPELLKGPTAICFGDEEDAAKPAKLSIKIEKKFEPFVIKGGILEGQMIDVNGVKDLANMPSREELLARLAHAFQGPIQGIASVLNALIRDLAVVVGEVAKVKPEEPVAETEVPAEASAEAAAAEETGTAETAETAETSEEAAAPVDDAPESGEETAEAATAEESAEEAPEASAENAGGDSENSDESEEKGES